MAVSGNNIKLDTAPVLASLTSGTALGYTPGAFSVVTAGDAFSYTESYTEGDDVPSVLSTTVTSGVVPACLFLVQHHNNLGWRGWHLAGTIATDGALTITAGGLALKQLAK